MIINRACFIKPALIIGKRITCKSVTQLATILKFTIYLTNIAGCRIVVDRCITQRIIIASYVYLFPLCFAAKIIHIFEAPTAIECHIYNVCYTAGNFYTRQTRTVCECELKDSSNTIWNRILSVWSSVWIIQKHGLFFIEQHSVYRAISGIVDININTFKTIAACEFCFAHNCHATRDCNTFEISASIKGEIVNTCNTVWNHHACQPCASQKCCHIDACHTTRDRYTRQF